MPRGNPVQQKKSFQQFDVSAYRGSAELEGGRQIREIVQTGC